MKKITLLLIIFSLNLGFGQQNYWNKTDETKLVSKEKFDRATNPSNYQIYNLNFQVFKELLANAPMENPELQSDLILLFPDFNGNLSRFKVFEAPVMEKELMDKFPSIKSYSAQGIDDRSATLRFSVTNFGLHVMSLSGDLGTYYIDTYTKDLNNYIVYSKKDIQPARQFGCLVQDEESMIEDYGRFDNQEMVNDGNLRQYRLAMSCTIEYSAFHLTAAGTPAAAPLATKRAVVLSAMVVTMTRVNGIYERDVAVRMNLIANNENIIFIDSDSFTNDDGFAMLNENQTVINAVIGSTNYDIGHVFSTGGGGVAQLASVCGSGKARGVTGSPSPVGDPFDVDYVAHEMGHQFGANHTQNNACQIDTSSSFEPGSASTIMGYAGICAPNVQNNSDAYFHARSIFQMTSFVTSSSANCRQLSASGNIAPVVNAGPNYIIPNGTAFKLTGSATDANGDALTYCWEQYNNDVSTQPPLTTATAGPNFRSVMPSTSPTRYFPRFQDVLNGNLAPTWEVVPTVARTMTFALTVRDNRAGAGMTNRADMTVTTAAVGPFRITSPSVDNTSWDPASTQTITWDVAGTTANGINTANVNILFSDDNGATFTTLVANTPNDGSEVITLPNVLSPYCRIMVESVGNIFYALSKNISLGYVVSVTTTCNDYTFNTPFAIPDNNPTFTVRSINVPTTANISDVNLAVNLTHTWVEDLQIILQGPMATVTQSTIFNRSCGSNDNISATFDDQGSAIVCAPTITGNVQPASPLNVFNDLNPNGNWLFAIRDLGAADTGNVQSFTLTVCSEEVIVTLNTDSFEENSIAIYPNPNSGNFNVQFSSNSGNEIKVLVHDIRGRQIFERSFNNSGLFNENINLNNVQSGVYMVTVLDGAQKQVKKIVVE